VNDLSFDHQGKNMKGSTREHAITGTGGCWPFLATICLLGLDSRFYYFPPRKAVSLAGMPHEARSGWLVIGFVAMFCAFPASTII